MRIRDFDWDADNVEHLAFHGVDPSEAEEVLRRSPYKRRVQKRKYLAYGQSADGRYLFVVFVLRQGGHIRVITARDMTQREKSAARRRYIR